MLWSFLSYYTFKISHYDCKCCIVDNSAISHNAHQNATADFGVNAITSESPLDYLRPENMPSLIDKYTFFDNDNETMEDLLNSIGLDLTSKCSTITSITFKSILQF